jgi:hypothetical protein
VPVRAAQTLCAQPAPDGTISVDRDTLERLMTSAPCWRKPERDNPMAFAITFDPDHKSWKEEGGTWTEQRTLRIE